MLMNEVLDGQFNDLVEGLQAYVLTAFFSKSRDDEDGSDPQRDPRDQRNQRQRQGA